MTAELVPAEPIEIRPANRGIFGDSTPDQVVEQAAAIAKTLAKVLDPTPTRGALYMTMGEGKKVRKHVYVEGWTLLASMLGITAVTTWTRPLEDGWEARVEVFNSDGRLIGAAESECRRSEGMWQHRPSYALRSMAATRATSKALRQPLGFIVTLAGFSATPSEEVTDEPAPKREPRKPNWLNAAKTLAMEAVKARPEEWAARYGARPDETDKDRAARLWADVSTAITKFESQEDVDAAGELIVEVLDDPDTPLVEIIAAWSAEDAEVVEPDGS